MKKVGILLMAFVLFVSMTACRKAGQESEQKTGDSNIPDRGIENGTTTSSDSENAEEEEMMTQEEDIEQMKMKVQIGNISFTATLEDNVATRELIEMMKQAPITIDMSDYSGFEKVGPLGRSLTTDNHQTTTSAGDIVLYNGNQIVIFYGSNSWSYTKIGKIDNLSGWKEALGNSSITVIFSIAE